MTVAVKFHCPNCSKPGGVLIEPENFKLGYQQDAKCIGCKSFILTTVVSKQLVNDSYYLGKANRKDGANIIQIHQLVSHEDSWTTDVQIDDKYLDTIESLTPGRSQTIEITCIKNSANNHSIKLLSPFKHLYVDGSKYAVDLVEAPDFIQPGSILKAKVTA